MKSKHTYQYLEESGEVDIELIKRLEANRQRDIDNPPFFFKGVTDYTPTDTQVLLLRM